MPLPLPNLDTRRFDDLVAEMRALIPQYAPEWTNHNPSDPGITLVELLAWLTEATLYRVNQIPEGVYRNFVVLLNPDDRNLSHQDLELLKRRAVQVFNEPYRAITAADFERVAKQAAPGQVARVRVQADESLGAVLVVVVPFPKQSDQEETESVKKLVSTVKDELNKRKLICTRVVVREPVYTEIELDITIVPAPNAKQEEVKKAAKEMITAYLDSLTGGPDGTGWPFGRAVTVFDCYKLLEPIPGVDHVKEVVMKHNGKLFEREIPVKDLPRIQPFRAVAPDQDSDVRDIKIVSP